METQRLVLTRTVDPATEPLTTAEAKTQIRVDHADEDTYIDTLITTAREYVEDYAGRALITQTWALRLDGFYEPILLPRPPLISVTSVKYIDPDGTEQTLDSSVYTVHANDLPPRITLAYGKSWPSIRHVPNAVTVTYQTGYGAAADVPGKAKQAMKLLIEDMYNERGDTVTGTIVSRIGRIHDLLAPPFKVVEF